MWWIRKIYIIYNRRYEKDQWVLSGIYGGIYTQMDRLEIVRNMYTINVMKEDSSDLRILARSKVFWEQHQVPLRWNLASNLTLYDKIRSKDCRYSAVPVEMEMTVIRESVSITFTYFFFFFWFRRDLRSRWVKWNRKNYMVHNRKIKKEVNIMIMNIFYYKALIQGLWVNLVSMYCQF